MILLFVLLIFLEILLHSYGEMAYSSVRMNGFNLRSLSLLSALVLFLLVVAESKFRSVSQPVVSLCLIWSSVQWQMIWSLLFQQVVLDHFSKTAPHFWYLVYLICFPCQISIFFIHLLWVFLWINIWIQMIFGYLYGLELLRLWER